jgi:hypothetical protein
MFTVCELVAARAGIESMVQTNANPKMRFMFISSIAPPILRNTRSI